jgi:hypothetical protein
MAVKFTGAGIGYVGGYGVIGKRGQPDLRDFAVEYLAGSAGCPILLQRR